MKRKRTKREALQAIGRARRAKETLTDSKITIILDSAGVEGVNHTRQVTTALRRFSITGSIKQLEDGLGGVPQARKVVTQAKKYQRAYHESRKAEGQAGAFKELQNAGRSLKRAMGQLGGQPDIKSRVWRAADTVESIMEQIRY